MLKIYTTAIIYYFTNNGMIYYLQQKHIDLDFSYNDIVFKNCTCVYS